MKRFVNLMSALILATATLVGAVVFFANAFREIKDLDEFEGVVVEKGVVDRKTEQGMRGVFYLKLRGLEQYLLIGNFEEHKQFLKNHFAVGDRVKVYFEKNGSQLYKIGDDGEWLADPGSVRWRDLLVGSFTAAACFLIIVLAYRHDKKLQ